VIEFGLIGLSIHFERWILIWIVNHILLTDLDWIDNLKKWIVQQPGYNNTFNEEKISNFGPRILNISVC